jgi:hypothetical protein
MRNILYSKEMSVTGNIFSSPLNVIYLIIFFLVTQKYSQYLKVFYLLIETEIYIHDAKLFAPNQKESCPLIFFKALNCSMENISIKIPLIGSFKH